MTVFLHIFLIQALKRVFFIWSLQNLGLGLYVSDQYESY